MHTRDLGELHGHWLDDADMAHVAALEMLIRANGFDHARPIIVAGDLDGAQIVNGRHRFLAAKSCGLDMVPVVVITHAELDALEAEHGDLDGVEMYLNR